MIIFKNGHHLEFACGAGALGFDGRGWPWEWPLRWLGLLDPHAFTVVAKTVTLKPRQGNLSWWHPWSCVRLVRDRASAQTGAVNAVGLTNPGIARWVDRDYPTALRHGYQLAASVAPANPAEAALMIPYLAPLKLAYVEVNLSCPNSPGHANLKDAVETVELVGNAGHPVVVKLSAGQLRRPDLVRTLNPHVDAYHAINTVPWADVFPGRPSPLSRYAHGLAGGVSGDFIRATALDCVRRLLLFTNRPVIGGGGIGSLEDVLTFAAAGATAYSLGSVFLRAPWRPNRIVRAYQRLNLLRPEPPARPRSRLGGFPSPP